ncbi:energy transducer TonB [Hoylesella nanceiensis]|uniref:energy transducer TonB n=1 Tax=Hoylesella nanceiensis TaxID=425941 RepID=UPI0036F35BC7
MKRINYSLILTSVALIVLLFSCGESEREEATSTANRNTESAETRAEKSDSKKEFTGKVYEIVEQMPEFPGGLTALMNYLRANIRYPAAAQSAGIEGRVIVAFIVEPDGSVSNAKLMRSIDPSIDQEALRVVRQMPKWIPGKQNGAAVRVKYNVPVTFKLQ